MSNSLDTLSASGPAPIGPRAAATAAPSTSGPPPSSKLRIAIVGGGKMAQHHARAIARGNLRAEVVAIAEPLAAAADAMRSIAPQAQVFADLTTLLSAAAVDVVHIVTPPATHCALAEIALNAGCHTYVEKPFVPTVTDAARLLRIAADRNLILCAGHQLLYEPPARTLRELLPALGHVSHVESYFSFRTVRRTPDGRAPLRADLQLLDILPHPVYLLLEVLEAVADGQTRLVSLEVGSGGTIHALIRRGDLTGVLTVTLEGRPIESTLRVVGSNGSATADFVRGTVQRHIGPGTSGIDKVLAPYALARQLLTGTTSALTRRVAKKQLTYPGLAELFGAFYAAIRGDGRPPMSATTLIETVRVWEQVAQVLTELDTKAAGSGIAANGAGRAIVITGGTGFLGRATTTAAHRAGARVTALARRLPASWDREPDVRYVTGDLSRADTLVHLFDGASVVIHCAAETAGGWDQHQTNSIDAAANAIRAAAAAGIRRFVHVSSIAVLPPPKGRESTSETTALYPNSRVAGPYVWGKLESERLAVRLGSELGVKVKIVRPGALVDYARFDPPGRLGRRIGNMFIAVGGPSQVVGVADVAFAGEMLAWIAEHFDDAPDVLHLTDPNLPTKRELLGRLRRVNPGMWTVWLPSPALSFLSAIAIVGQKALRPRRQAMNVSKMFAPQRLDTSSIQTLARRAGTRPPIPPPGSD